jgi:hypothetical protein
MKRVISPESYANIWKSRSLHGMRKNHFVPVLQRTGSKTTDRILSEP